MSPPKNADIPAARTLALLLALACLTTAAHALALAPLQVRPPPPPPAADQPPPPLFANKDPRDKRAASRAIADYRKLHKRHEQSPEVWTALGDLGHFDLPAVADVALDEMECEQVEHHAQARRLIAGLQAADSVERVLDKGMDKKRADVRAQTILALGSGRPEAVDWLTPTQAALDDEDAGVRAAAVETLGLARAQARLDRILELVEDESPRVRQQLPAALVRLVAERSVPMLRALSEDPSWRVRSAVVRAFGQLGRRPASEELVAILEREVGRVQEDAHQELVALTHADFGPDVEAWRRFLQSHPAHAPEPEPTPARDKPMAEGGTTVAPLTEDTYFDVPVLSRRMMLVIDVSNSMTTVEQPRGNDDPDAKPLTRLELTKREVQKLLLGFGPEVSLDLVRFGDNADSWKEKLVPMKSGPRSAACKELEGYHPSGGTNLQAALAVCFDLAQDSLDDLALEDETPDTLYVLTDGQPNSPPDLLLEYVAERNRELNLRVHCICLSRDAMATKFMRELAELTRGEYANPLE